MKKVLIIGATSAIAEATARLFAIRGSRLFLIARNEERLRAIAKDLKVRGAATADYSVLDVNNLHAHSDILNQAANKLGDIEIAIIAHGTLPDQKTCERNLELTLQELNTNAISTISLLTHIANRLEKQGYGTIAVISSVAGDRGRQSNYIYGTAKAAVTTFMQGLRNRLYGAGVHVLTVKPGFVDTPMTAKLEKGSLWAQPEDIAKGIIRAVENKKDVVYLPWFWRGTMLLIRSIPETVFKKLKL